MRTRLLALSAAAALLTAGRAAADIAPPPPPARSMPLTIEVDPKATGPKLVIPVRALLQRGGRPEPGTGAAPAPASAPPGGGEFGARPRSHTLIAGVALAAALTLGGLWLVRRDGRGPARGLAALLAAGGVLGAGALLWANAPAPPPQPPPPPVQEGELFSGKVQVQFANQGDAIRLVLDGKSLQAVKAGPKERPAAVPGAAAPPNTAAQPPAPRPDQE
ncbi:MAG TPA: hypothetical protein VIL46_09285 [Gemmataceae bacterium]